MSPPLPPIVLTFAATDPTGGAGIQADLLTFASMGCHPLSVVTAVTVQDTSGVDGIHAIDSDWVSDQARTLLEDMPVAAFKIGFVGSLDNIGAIAAIVADYPDVPLVLDPVMASGRGDEMAGEEMIAALRELLVPQTTVITPNSQEARRLAARDGAEPEDTLPLADCAQRILALGCEHVLITGTHEATPNVINTLFGEGGEVSAEIWDRLPGSYHGSGCTLASAIAALLASGLGVGEAVREAQEFTWHALAAGFRPGMGQHLPDRFFWARQLREADDDAMTEASPVRGLYAITPDEADTAILAEKVRRAIQGGAKVVQYRNKVAAPALRSEQVRALLPHCRAASVPLIVNDDLELALETGADGVHLGREDGDLKGARDRLGPRKLLGASCYASLELARKALDFGADHLAFGSVFGSITKPGAARASHALFSEARSLGVPLVAIGGITPGNARQVIDAGADAVAVISALFDSPDVAAEARKFALLFEAR